MPALSDYVAGTITLTNGLVAFTGTGTGWQAADFREGDTIFQVAGQTQWDAVIATIASNTSGTLAQPWGGATGTYAYRMRYMADGARVTAQARNLIELLGNGNLQALAALTGPGIPVFNGPHSMIVTPVSDFVNGAFYNVQVNTLADRAAYNSQPGPTATSPGYAVLVSDIGDGRSAIYSKLSDTSGDWSAPAYVTAKPRIDILVDDPGRPGASEVLLKAVIPIALTFAMNLSGSYVSVGNLPAANAIYSFTKNGTQFGTLTITPAGIATFAGSVTTFAPGDILRVIAPNPRDASLSAVSMTLSATR